MIKCHAYLWLQSLSGKYFDKPKKSKKPKFTSKFTKNIVEKNVTENRSIKKVEELIEKLLEEHFSQVEDLKGTEK